jgi:HEAT repeat protein
MDARQRVISLEGGFMQLKSSTRGLGLFLVSMVRLMVLVAVVAVLCWAWLYHNEHADVERSWATIHLRALRQDVGVQRRFAAENLDRAGADDVARVVAGLAGALGDPDWQVRRAAARSLANVIQRGAANPKKAMIDEIERAMRALVPAVSDPRTEVRIAAMESVEKLGDICRPSLGAPGRSPAPGVAVPQAKQAAAALLRAMDDPAIHVRAQAVRSLARVGPSAGIDWTPIKWAEENDPAIEVRAAAMDAIIYMGLLEQMENQDVLGL